MIMFDVQNEIGRFKKKKRIFDSMKIISIFVIVRIEKKIVKKKFV